jgi:hypothetical protein
MGRIISSLPKAKKSYTLSTESVRFLEATRKRRHAQSVSAVLEEILQQVREEQDRTSLEKAVADYYTSLTSKEAAELTQWGEFADAEFRRVESSK